MQALIAAALLLGQPAGRTWPGLEAVTGSVATAVDVADALAQLARLEAEEARERARAEQVARQDEAKAREASRLQALLQAAQDPLGMLLELAPNPDYPQAPGLEL